uniref:AAA family ATPase n=1 Tax=Streptomyces sp. N35 TaxID=2795730 RepID=UPI0018F63D68
MDRAGSPRIARAEAELGREGALVVTGPPGIGKSALLDALAERATARGGTVHRLRSQLPDQGVPFALVADLLLSVERRHLERLPTPQRDAVQQVLRHEAASDGGPDPLGIRLALGAVLKAAAPALIVLDDVHWADPASAAALACVQALPTAVVAACPDMGGAPEFLYGAPQFTPSPLAVDEVAALLTGEGLPARLAGRVHRCGGGNPRITMDIARAVAALPRPPHPLDELPVPERVHAMARRRLDDVGPPVRRVLLTAALADRPTHALLRRSAGRDVAEEVRAAARAGLVTAEGNELRFTAEVFASQLTDDSSWADRAAAHRSLAGAVTDPVAATRHLALATDDIDARLADDLGAAAATARTPGGRGRAAGLALLPGRRP